MLQIAICDDILEHAERLESMIRAADILPNCIIERYSTASALIERIQASVQFDIIFLDIELVGENGIQVAKVINALMPDTQIIFVSAYLSLAIDIFDAVHVYFLMKPVIPARLNSALERAVDNIRNNKDKQILLPVRGSTTHVFNLSDIVYFERVRRTTVICAKVGNPETALKLSELEEQLPAGLFSRPHSSYLVNLSHVKKIDRFNLHMDNGELLPISNQRRPSFKTDIASYIAL